MRSPIAVTAFWLILGIGCWIRLGSSYLEGMRPNERPNPDYFQDWASARNFLAGLPVYSPHSRAIPRYLGRPARGVEREFEYNAHPPTSVLLAVPLARLEFRDAMLVWNLVSLVAFLAGLAIIAAEIPEIKALYLPVATVLPFCFPVYANFHQGQLTLVLVFLITASWALDRSDRPGAAGVLIGLAAAIKLFPAYLIIYFAARRRTRALIAAAVAFAALTLVTAMLLGIEAFRDYLYLVLPQHDSVRTWWTNLSITGFCHKLFDPTAGTELRPVLWSSPALARWGMLLTDLAVTAILAAVASRARSPARRDIAYSVAVSAMLLVSPITWQSSMIFLLLPVAVIARDMDRSRHLAVLLALILPTIWLPQEQLTELILAGGFIHLGPSALLLGPLSAKTYALFLVFALGLAAFRAQEGSESRP